MTPSPALARIHFQYVPVSHPVYMIGCLVVSDIIALSAAVLGSVAIKIAVTGPLDLSRYLELWPFLTFFILVYASVGLYSGVALSPPEELRRATLLSAVVFVFLAVATFSLRGAKIYITWTLLTALAFSVFLMPLMRALVRQWFAAEKWWGYPAVVFGADKNAQMLVRAMLREPELGLKPIAVVDDESNAAFIEGIPVVNGADLEAEGVCCRSFVYGVVGMPSQASVSRLMEEHGPRFSHMLVIPNIANLSTLWVSPKRLGGMLGLEVRQQVLASQKRVPKRMLDLALTILFAPILLPLVGILALLVRLESPGAPIYGHKRIGKGNRMFTAWKLRSMVINSDEVLQRHLEQNPELREEWLQNHKLKKDPRITKVGAFLRKTSLDELPQLWNVLKGEMSLVGPRPIVAAEVPKYGRSFALYTTVPGGLTGLWQVSGRNNTTYEERVSLDTFYMRNWSVWLDLCILFRTIGTVLFRKGAY